MGWGSSKRQARYKVKETLKGTGWVKPQMPVNYPRELGTSKGTLPVNLTFIL